MNQGDIAERLNRHRSCAYTFAIEALCAHPKEKKNEDSRIYVITSDQERVLRDISKLVLAKCKKHGNVPLDDFEGSIVDKLGLSIQSGKGSGKTATLAIVLIWFLFCFEKSVVMATATKLDQVKDVLWREVSKWIGLSINGCYGRMISDLLEVKGTKIYVKAPDIKQGKEWYAIARSAPSNKKSDTPAETMQGLHADYMLLIADEASGISDSVFMPIKTTLTSFCNLVLVTFNPIRTSGFAYDSQNKNREWFMTYQWNCENCENIDPSFIEARKKEYGENSNQYRINVQGLPPLAESDTLIGLNEVMRAVDRDIEPLDGAPFIVGIDIGRGTDKTTIVSRRGNKVIDVLEDTSADHKVTLEWIQDYLVETNPDWVGIDTIGMGGTIYDLLKANFRQVHSVNVAREARDKTKYFRLRDELWCKLQKLFHDDLIDIPDHHELIFELSNIKIDQSYDRGLTKIESKKKMRERLVKSPNFGDALMMTMDCNDRIFYAKYTESISRSSYKDDLYEGSWMSA